MYFFLYSFCKLLCFLEQNDNNAASKKLKADSLLLMRGFDSIATSLFHLTANIETALQVPSIPISRVFILPQVPVWDPRHKCGPFVTLF